MSLMSSHDARLSEQAAAQELETTSKMASKMAPANERFFQIKMNIRKRNERKLTRMKVVLLNQPLESYSVRGL